MAAPTQSPDSSIAGFLAPSGAFPYDDALTDILQSVVVGMTGLNGKMVRPRWQPQPPVQPEYTVNWVALGVSKYKVDTFAYEGHAGAGDGTSTVERDEIIHVLHSFYGPNCSGYCERFRDGFEVAQNRDILAANSLGLIEVGEAMQVPALFKERWVPRVDVLVMYRRRTTRTYNIRNLLSGQFSVDIESIVTPTIVTNQ